MARRSRLAALHGLLKARKWDPRQIGERFVPSCDIVAIEFVEMCVATGAGHDLHELHRGGEEGRELLGALLNIQLLAKVSFLCGDASGAIIGIADACGHAADRLHGAVGNGHSIGAQRHGLHEVDGDA